MCDNFRGKDCANPWYCGKVIAVCFEKLLQCSSQLLLCRPDQPQFLLLPFDHGRQNGSLVGVNTQGVLPPKLLQLVLQSSSLPCLLLVVADNLLEREHVGRELVFSNPR